MVQKSTLQDFHQRNHKEFALADLEVEVEVEVAGAYFGYPAVGGCEVAMDQDQESFEYVADWMLLLLLLLLLLLYEVDEDELYETVLVDSVEKLDYCWSRTELSSYRLLQWQMEERRMERNSDF